MKTFSLKRFDLFGRAATFKTAGNDVHSTWLGLFFSICIYAIVAAYASFKFVIMVTYEDTSVTEKIEHRALDRGFSFSQEDGFRIAFTLFDVGTRQYFDDPEYVQFKPFFFRWSAKDSWIEPVSYHKCTDDDE